MAVRCKRRQCKRRTVQNKTSTLGSYINTRLGVTASADGGQALQERWDVNNRRHAHANKRRTLAKPDITTGFVRQ